LEDGKNLQMSFLGNIAAAQTAKALGKYNSQNTYQQALYARKKAAINEKFYDQVTLPLLKRKQEKQRGELLVGILRSGAEARPGTTPYELMLENTYNQAFNLVMADYNKEMDKMDQLNQSLMLEAQATGQLYQGKLTARAQYFAAAGSLLGDANKMGMI